MIDEMIGIGATFDVITPIASILQDIANGPSCGFGLPADAGFSARAVEKLLTAKGVKIWGLMIVDNIIIFRVRKAQAGWARIILEQAQVPILYSPRETHKPSKWQPRTKKDSADPLDQLFRLLDDLARRMG